MKKLSAPDTELPEIIPVTEMSILDEGDPRSVLRLVPQLVGTQIKEHVYTNPELFDKDERDLFRWLRKAEQTPSPTDNRLRLKFWMEYDRVMSKGDAGINMTNVLAGICSKELFYAHYLKRPNKVAWLLCPPTGYMIKSEEALEFGIEQLRDILEQPHVITTTTKYGVREVVDARLAGIKLHIVEMLDARVKGAVVQRSMNVNLHANAEKVEKEGTASTMADLERQLKELRRREKSSRNLPPGPASDKPVIEVDSE